MRVSTWMKRDVITVSPDGSLGDAELLMQQHRVRHLPVVGERRLLGILTDEDVQAARPSYATTLLIREIYHQMCTTRVAEVMTRDVITVAPGTSLAQAARLMRDRNIGALPVLRDQELVGILTGTDLLELLETLLRGDGDADERFPEEL